MDNTLRRSGWRGVVIAGMVGSLGGCTSATRSLDSLPTATFETSMVFLADRSLNRAEDGVALGDGRLIVSDQVYGLRVVARDGTSTPFGNMPGAGYLHDPPARHGAANGVSLEPNGKYVLVADVYGGGIYRVRLRDGATERAYQHRFGVNTACRDSTGAIWFTQSTECTAESGEARMFAAVDVPIADGSVWRVGSKEGEKERWRENTAVLVHGGLKYANGLLLDEKGKRLYVAETCADRVLSAPLDVGAGTVGEFSTLVSMTTPDNLEMDTRGRLWIASPIGNEVRVVDTKTGESRSVFREQSAEQVARAAEFVRRGRESIPRLALFTPQIWQPLPGPVTGVILVPGEDEVYVTGLGNALIRLRR